MNHSTNSRYREPNILVDTNSFVNKLQPNLTRLAVAVPTYFDMRVRCSSFQFTEYWFNISYNLCYWQFFLLRNLQILYSVPLALVTLRLNGIWHRDKAKSTSSSRTYSSTNVHTYYASPHRLNVISWSRLQLNVYCTGSNITRARKEFCAITETALWRHKYADFILAACGYE
jgi:hypothetical protein